MTDTSIFLLAFLQFCFRKKALKMLSFQGFLLLKEALVVTLSETRALTFRKHEAQKGMKVTII